jgi:hypothetical protein
VTERALCAAITLFAISSSACRGGGGPRASAARADVGSAPTPPAPPAPPAQDTSFGGTTAPVHRARALRPGVPPGMLRAVETPAGGAGYDRVVFQFTGDSVPGYSVEYATAPVQRCGSGDPVSVAGAGRLVVRFEPARAHDEQGHVAPLERDRALGLPTVKALKLVCDFEGQVEWVLGVATAAPFRVSELTGPARLVLDVKHAP